MSSQEPARRVRVKLRLTAWYIHTPDAQVFQIRNCGWPGQTTLAMRVTSILPAGEWGSPGGSEDAPQVMDEVVYGLIDDYENDCAVADLARSGA